MKPNAKAGPAAAPQDVQLGSSVGRCSLGLFGSMQPGAAFWRLPPLRKSAPPQRLCEWAAVAVSPVAYRAWEAACWCGGLCRESATAMEMMLSPPREAWGEIKGRRGGGGGKGYTMAALLCLKKPFFVSL